MIYQVTNNYLWFLARKHFFLNDEPTILYYPDNNYLEKFSQSYIMLKNYIIERGNKSSISLPSAFLDNYHFMLFAMSINVAYMQHASERLLDNRDFVLAGFQFPSNGAFNLFCVSNRLREDREVILASVRQNGLNFSEIRDEFRWDKEVIIEALNENLEVIQLVPEEMLRDYDVRRILHPYITFFWITRQC
ncbi:DUF4116 domain-containing protein [Legionella tunisiensis]|uniref:DUF4116 domain-containing protein n=1 Tax=Legionella tunisiensis TaxID=1034944 RepID=UPI000311F4F1|nr:DUF4116 domain-containing protein [Legionella tunisiensis]